MTKPVYLTQDILEFVLGILNPVWNPIHKTLHINGIDIVIILVLMMHFFYFLFFWKGRVKEKLEE